MWGWGGIFLGLLGGLIAITPIKVFIKSRFPQIKDNHIDYSRIVIIITLAVIGMNGLRDRISNQRKLNAKIVSLEEKIETLNNQPDWDENMWSMITGLPANLLKEYFDASNLYYAKDYSESLKKIEWVIVSYESQKDWDLKGYDQNKHTEKVAEFYLLASKIYHRLNKPQLAYENSKKAVSLRPTGDAHYCLAAAAYNQKFYEEALENINKAIELGPADLQVEYQNIKARILKHLNE